ncbi:MAG: UvrD-helicase domain-containing protein [Clostridia bacterium]|nr:UvrD-helicase domain-containing protein [Clostridia bacterium]
MNQQEWAHEEAHLAQTLETVVSERRKVEAALGMTDGNDTMVMVNDDQSSDAIVQLQITRSNLQTLHQLRLSSRSPYFARLDFTPAPGTPSLGGMRAGVNAPVYIGRWGVLKTPEYQVAVHDWRSPVANLYYSGQVGQVHYDAPDGAVHGEMTLKRMFTIEDQKLTSMQDTGVVGQEKFLTDALSQVTTARLREVVTTIQAEQNTVIRYDPMKPLCVQGVAGSGKTTIALHRIAWMLYRLQKTTRPDQMLILAPNPLFLSYISRVLPDLGVDKVRQLTFDQLCRQLLDKKMPRLTASARLSERLHMTKAERDALDNVLRMKGALERWDDLQAFLARWEESCIPKVNIKLGSVVLITAEDLKRYYLREFRHFPLQVRVAKTRAVVADRLKKAMAQVEEKLEKMAQDRLDQLLRAMPDSPERRERARKLLDARDQRMQELKDKQKQLLKEYDAMWGSMDLLQVYAAFLKEMAEKDAAHQPVLDATLPMLLKKRAAPEDLPALLILARALYDIKRPDIRHVVIDEAQDVSPLQIKTLRALFGTDAFTLVGDLCQGIYGDEGLRSWDALSEGIFDEKPHVAHLSTAYRSTVEIMETAFAVMARHPVQGAGEAKPVLRHGPAPVQLAVQEEKQRPAVIAQQVDDWRREGFANIALVVKTEKAAKALHKQLLAIIPDVRLVEQGDDSFEGGVQVMDASLVKGLEFDCVLIADAEDAVYPDERFYAKLFYVLCTRPLHRLAFACRGAQTQHLASCNAAL